MKLDSVTINNYRSISNLSIKIDEIAGKNCVILLGINEAGKSNILKALSLIDSAIEVNYLIDCNKQAQDTNEDIYVNYKFIQSKEEEEELLSKIKLPEELVKKIKISSIEKIININESEKSNYYNICIEESNYYSDYIFNSVTNEVNKITEIYKGSDKITAENIQTLVNADSKLLDQAVLEEIVKKNTEEYIESVRPKIIFWKPSPEYLMNESINLNEFKEDLTKSIPLRNIFKLSNINNNQIKSRIESIANDEDKRTELEEILTDNVTRYINKIWKDHKINIKVRIEENLFCKVKVEDKDNNKPKFRMDQRSDGFKQFISILLNISAENDTDELKNKIILLDEPEVHLHPSGIKYLRDELLKIAKNNVVFVATHSIFMVDKLNIERHVSIWKDENSITQYEKIDRDNPIQEEVIYEALGTSIFEIIKEHIIVFEGKSDKDYFDFFTKKFRNELNVLDFYTIAATGVDKIPNYVSFLKGSLFKGYILVDSDKQGMDVKSEIIKNHEELKERIFEINDIKNFSKKVTLEDLLPLEKITKYFNQQYECDFSPIETEPIIEQMQKYLKENSKYINDVEFKKFKLEMHQELIKDLVKKSSTKEVIKNTYSKYFDFITAFYLKINI